MASQYCWNLSSNNWSWNRLCRWRHCLRSKAKAQAQLGVWLSYQICQAGLLGASHQRPCLKHSPKPDQTVPGILPGCQCWEHCRQFHAALGRHGRGAGAGEQRRCSHTGQTVQSALIQTEAQAAQDAAVLSAQTLQAAAVGAVLVPTLPLQIASSAGWAGCVLVRLQRSHCW